MRGVVCDEHPHGRGVARCDAPAGEEAAQLRVQGSGLSVRAPPAASREQVRTPSRGSNTTLETTQGQMIGFFSQLLFKCYLEEVASVGDWRKICPRLDSRVENGLVQGLLALIK